MSKIATTVNQSSTAPTTGGTEYNLWLEFINRGLQEWTESHDWEVLKKTFITSVTGLSQASVALPLDFNKLAMAPRLHEYGDSEEEVDEFADIIQEQRGLYASTDKYVYTTGDSSSGLSLVFHPATLASGVSLEIVYYATPTSLASPADIPIIPDSQFLVDRTIAYIFEARSDPRFQQMEVKARERLMTMIENADATKYNSYNSPNYVITQERKMGFRLGRD